MSLIDDIATDLTNAGLGNVGINIYKSHLPDNDTEAIAVLDTGGVEPDKYITAMDNPTFQIIVRANNYSDGKSRIDTVKSRLHGRANVTLGSTYFYFIHAQAEPGHIGRNDRGQDEFSINFIAKTR